MTEKQSGGPPSRPPPPGYLGASPPYMEPQGATYPMSQPGETLPYGAPPPPYYNPPPHNQAGYPPPGGFQVPPNQVPSQGPPPPGYPGGQSLYPDLTQLPQPQAGTVLDASFTKHVAFHPAAMHHPSVMPNVEHTPHSDHIAYLEHMPSAPPSEPSPAYEKTAYPRVQVHPPPGAFEGIPYATPKYCQTYPSSSHIYPLAHPEIPDDFSGRLQACGPDAQSNLANTNTALLGSDRHSAQMMDSKLPLGFVTFGGPQMTPDPNQASCGVQPPAVPPPPAIPVRSAPPPPPTSQQGQASWWANLKEGEAPPGCVISWKGGDGLNLYFIQEEGHIVSPKKPLQMALFKKINGKGDVVEESLVGMVEVLGCWRLRLHGKNSFTLHTYNDTYVFLDDSTCPSKSGRFVIVELPADVSKTMRADLLALLNELTDLREEQEGVVGKITTNVETVYSDITKKLNTAVKDVVPGAHKSTKWLRKGTGSLVRMGGNIVSKGMHLIADQMPANQATEHEEESPIHTELMEALITFHKSKEAGSITYI